MSFKSDLERFEKTAENNFELVFKFSAFELSRRVIRRTPVKTGRARANWQPTFDAPAETMLDVQSKSGSTALEAVRVKLGEKRKPMFYLINNLPYIEALEQGSSSQSPSGMVKISIVEFPYLVEQKAAQNG